MESSKPPYFVVLPCNVESADRPVDFALDQIVPVSDDAENGPKVIAASVAEPYILLMRDDRSIIVLRTEDNGEIEEVPKPPALVQKEWQFGALYDDADDAFHLPLEIEDTDDVGTVLMFMLGCDGSLHVRFLLHLDSANMERSFGLRISLSHCTWRLVWVSCLPI